ncbi:cbb3-type cytochrome c oxidase N-terminal domain-containing protein [Synechococcus sp. Cruz CV-v-12]|uniref:cbb3-type cytochrome c oxidase N-terminal domain-containing protein n=1 Tax=Synechococcus sp. Cruz CV-v-12 TaxID=2823728 RepID=UPI0020CFBEDD|nr:cbb3-type cytochrome c oxidase N-terminal domain-containing protein [Synechococcus sp. Cruz CV-v-12]MCP9874708.1 c-type cytochrome [Synechococcus sp. Cruz CV-v-12]
MSKQKEPAVLAHEYDGIREYDNPTPAWWHLIFIATLAFSAVYIPFWHFSIWAWTEQEAWKENQVVEFKRVFGAVGDLQSDEATILRMMNDEKMLGVAESIFIGNCALCHAKTGGGINGVNLTDNAYKNVKKLEDLYAVIAKGANLGAMPGWEQKLSKNEMVILSAYVATLRGRNLPGRAAEGEVIPSWPSVPPAQPASPAPAKKSS